MPRRIPKSEAFALIRDAHIGSRFDAQQCLNSDESGRDPTTIPNSGPILTFFNSRSENSIPLLYQPEPATTATKLGPSPTESVPSFRWLCRNELAALIENNSHGGASQIFWTIKFDQCDIKPSVAEYQSFLRTLNKRIRRLAKSLAISIEWHRTTDVERDNRLHFHLLLRVEAPNEQLTNAINFVRSRLSVLVEEASQSTGIQGRSWEQDLVKNDTAVARYVTKVLKQVETGEKEVLLLAPNLRIQKFSCSAGFFLAPKNELIRANRTKWKLARIFDELKSKANESEEIESEEIESEPPKRSEIKNTDFQHGYLIPSKRIDQPHNHLIRKPLQRIDVFIEIKKTIFQHVDITPTAMGDQRIYLSFQEDGFDHLISSHHFLLHLSNHLSVIYILKLVEYHCCSAPHFPNTKVPKCSL